MKLRSAALVAGLMLGLMSGTAKSAPLNFSFLGDYTSASKFSLKFTLDSSPSPDTTSVNSYFEIDDVSYSVRFDQIGEFQGTGNFFFRNQGSGGAFAIADYSGIPHVIEFFGPELFSGDVSRPTFKIGQFGLVGDVLDPGGEIIPGSDITGTLTISAVPLPSSAPMFGAALLGLAGVSYAAKRKKAAAAA